MKKQVYLVGDSKDTMSIYNQIGNNVQVQAGNSQTPMELEMVLDRKDNAASKAKPDVVLYCDTVRSDSVYKRTSGWARDCAKFVHASEESNYVNNPIVILLKIDKKFDFKELREQFEEKVKGDVGTWFSQELEKEYKETFGHELKIKIDPIVVCVSKNPTKEEIQSITKTMAEQCVKYVSAIKQIDDQQTKNEQQNLKDRLNDINKKFERIQMKLGQATEKLNGMNKDDVVAYREQRIVAKTLQREYIKLLEDKEGMESMQRRQDKKSQAMSSVSQQSTSVDPENRSKNQAQAKSDIRPPVTKGGSWALENVQKVESAVQKSETEKRQLPREGGFTPKGSGSK